MDVPNFVSSSTAANRLDCINTGGWSFASNTSTLAVPVLASARDKRNFTSAKMNCVYLPLNSPVKLYSKTQT